MGYYRTVFYLLLSVLQGQVHPPPFFSIILICEVLWKIHLPCCNKYSIVLLLNSTVFVFFFWRWCRTWALVFFKVVWRWKYWDLFTYFLCTNLAAKFLQNEKISKAYGNIVFSQVCYVELELLSNTELTCFFIWLLEY